MTAVTPKKFHFTWLIARLTQKSVMFLIDQTNKLQLIVQDDFKKICVMKTKKSSIFEHISIKIGTVETCITRDLNTLYTTVISVPILLNTTIIVSGILLSKEIFLQKEITPLNTSFLCAGDKTADLTIVCNNWSTKVHSHILINKSKVFMKLLTSNMKEKKEKKIIFVDVETDTVKSFIKYIYGINLNMEKFSINDMYIFSDQYELFDINRQVIDYVKINVNKDNIIEIYKAFSDISVEISNFCKKTKMLL